MYVLTLTPSEASAYYDTYNQRSFREIKFALWTFNGDPEPADCSTREEVDTWTKDQDIKTLSRDDIDDLKLGANQELRLDAAVWVHRTPSSRVPTGLSILSHKMRESDPNGHETGTGYSPYDISLVMYFVDGEEIDRFISSITLERKVVYGNHNPDVVESS